MEQKSLPKILIEFSKSLDTALTNTSPYSFPVIVKIKRVFLEVSLLFF